MDDVDASALGEPRTVTQLDGQSGLGPVDDGLSVKADYFDFRWVYAEFRTE